MKTKKLIAGIVSAVTFASIAVSAIASAADGFTVKISSEEVEAGADFTLTMDLESIPKDGINACEFGISYDSKLVSVSSVTLSKDVTGSEDGLPAPLEVNIEKDVVNLMYALGTTDGASYLKGDVTFLNIKGTVNDDAKAGAEAEFKVVPVDRAVKPGSSDTNKDFVFGYMSDDDSITKYDPAFVSGTVTVKGAEAETTEPKVTTTKPDDKPITTTTKKGDDKPDVTTTTKKGDDKPDVTTTTKKGEEKPDVTTTTKKGDVEVTTKATTTKKPTTTIDLPDGTFYGDVDDSGDINIADAVALNLYLLDPEENPLTLKGLANADCVKDKEINLSDSTLLMNYIAEIVKISELGKA